MSQGVSHSPTSLTPQPMPLGQNASVSPIASMQDDSNTPKTSGSILKSLAKPFFSPKSTQNDTRIATIAPTSVAPISNAPINGQNPSTVFKPIIELKPHICYFARVQDRGENKTFGILNIDRQRHMYVLGKTGMGKTTLLTNMVLQDIYNGYGCCFIDPHGDSVEYILDRIPKNRQNDVIYFNPADTEFPIGFNILEAKHGEEPFLIASGLMAVFKRIWAGMWSARMEYILNNTLLALLETEGNTLLGVVRMLTDNDYRDEVVRGLQDPMVKNFWIKEFGSFNDRYRTEAIAPVLNKIGQFFSTDLIRNILGQTKSTIDLRDIMDNQKILLVNLSKGRLGEDNSELLGSLLVTKLQLAAMSRVDIPEEERKDFYLYVDEFQNFTTDSFATILSEARKYKLNLILAHQYIAQLTEAGNEKIKNAIFGNVGTLITFRIGSDDAFKMEKEFEPIFTTQQLINLNQTQIALKLSIQGKATDPFMAATLAPLFHQIGGRKSIIIDLSRERYGMQKAIIKDRINRWLAVESATSSTSKKKRKKKINPFLLDTIENRTNNITNPSNEHNESISETTSNSMKRPHSPHSHPQTKTHSQTTHQSFPTLSQFRTRLSSLKQNTQITPQTTDIQENEAFDIP